MITKIYVLKVTEQYLQYFKNAKVDIKFGNGLLTSCVLDSLTSMIDCR